MKGDNEALKKKLQEKAYMMKKRISNKKDSFSMLSSGLGLNKRMTLNTSIKTTNNLGASIK
jgi:hypothetical protein